MAHHVEPMDVDCMDSDFDNKENTYHHSNVLPCTEKGYEELDVSELNMKLRYSMTPASSPMSKSFTASVDNRNIDTDESLSFSNDNSNLTRSLNLTMTKNDSVIKTMKCLPLQELPTKELVDSNGNPSVLRQLDATITNDANITVTVSRANDIGENVSLPSSSSSVLNTPEATTPTKEVMKDGGSPILRGLKSVFNLFRPSQSPIPPVENDITVSREVLNSSDKSTNENIKQTALASTPIAAHRSIDGNNPKKGSPYKDSIVFNDDLEKELNWQDETTILFNEEKIPVHKLFFQNSKSTHVTPSETKINTQMSKKDDYFNSTVEYMDISCNDSMLNDRTMTELPTDNNKPEINAPAPVAAVESDSEFLDCETTLSRNVSVFLECKESEVDNSLNINNHSMDFIGNLDNATVVNPVVESDITGFSITEGEIKNDATHSDYFDYSKETIELLSELKKLEENVMPKIELSNTTVKEKEIEKMNIAKIYTKTQDKPDDDHIKQLDVAEEMLKQIENTSIEVKNITITEPIESSVLYTSDQKMLDINIVEGSNNTESYGLSEITSLLCMDNAEVAKEVLDTVPSEITNILPNEIRQEMPNAPDIKMVVDVPRAIEELSNETRTMPSETLNVMYGTIMSEMSVLETEKPSDIPLPDEDDIDKTEQMSNAPKNEIELHVTTAVEELSNKTKTKASEIMSEMTVLEIEKPSDIPLPDEDDFDKREQISPKNEMEVHVVTAVEELSNETKTKASEIMSEMSVLQIDNEYDIDKREEISNAPKNEIEVDVPTAIEELSNETRTMASVITSEISVLEINNEDDVDKREEISNSLKNEIEVDVPTAIEELSNETRTMASVITSEISVLEINNKDDVDKREEISNSLKNEIEVDVPTAVEEISNKTRNMSSEMSVLEIDNEDDVDKREEISNAPKNDIVVDVPTAVEAEAVEISNETSKTLTSETLNVTYNMIMSEISTVLKHEKPSDIPLPDDDNIFIDIATGEPVLTIQAETVMIEPPVTTSVLSNQSLTHGELPKVANTDKIENDSLHPVVIITSSLKKEEQGSENLLSNLNITEIICNKPKETILEFQMRNNDKSVKSCVDSSIESVVLIPTQNPDITSTLSNSDSFKILENYSNTNKPETSIGNKMGLTEIELLSGKLNISSVDHTYDCISNIAQIIGDSVTNTLDVTVTENELTSNKLSQIQPMVILNEAHNLPDLVNLTASIADENSINVKTTSDMGSRVTPKQDEVPIKTGNIKMYAEVERIKTDEEDIIDSESNDLNSTDMRQQIEKSSNENQNMIINLVHINAKSEVDSENFQSDSKDLGNNIPTDNAASTKNTEITKVEVANAEEDFIMSANDSPYVSLIAGVETGSEKIEQTYKEIENPLIPIDDNSSSPPITSKGYSFNFDEIDDPFATKTKIRLSPPIDTPTKSTSENVNKMEYVVPKKVGGNRRKSQPSERKRQALTHKKFNKTFEGTVENVNDGTMANIEIDHSSDTKLAKETVPIQISESFDTTPNLQGTNNTRKSVENLGYSLNASEKPHNSIMEIKSSIDSVSIKSSETKSTSSSEQSVYYSAGVSSTESVQSKNVFNLPEIDDINFNPFATKSKMRQSPPPDSEAENPPDTTTNIKICPNTSLNVHPLPIPSSTNNVNNWKIHQVLEDIDSDDKIETEPMEKDTSHNVSNTTSSLKDTDDQNLSIPDVNIEDEDTIEGPFLDIDNLSDKMSDVANTDMIQFTHSQGAEDNMEDAELFIDAEAYEFLLNQNPRSFVTDSGKESLFLKFDPLFANKIPSDGVLTALSNMEKKQSTPTKPTQPSLKTEASPVAGPSTLNVTKEGDNNISQENNDDDNTTIAKPMMVVTPAVNSDVTPRKKSTTPTRSNRCSITFTSPAIAVIDRLLSMSANNSFLEEDTTIIQTNREQMQADLALTQLRELLAEKESNVHNLRSESRELKDRLATMETQVRILEAHSQERLKKIKDLNDHLIEKTRINKSMAAVVEEYERTIASLIAEIEQDKKRNAEERIKLISERDEQTAHLASMEVSFNDLHSKYEKNKQVILACKANEEIYKKTIKDFEENFAKLQSNYEMLKTHATSKLNYANQEFEKMNRTHETNVLKLNAMIKRKSMLITSLEETLAQKTKANEELTAICDELLNKVG